MATTADPKDPVEVLDYTFNFTRALSGGDTISSYVVAADGTASIQSDAENSNVVTVWISGGTSGDTTELTCTVTSVAGRIIKVVIYIPTRAKS